MELKQQDIYVALKLVALNGEPCSMQRLGEALGMSASRVHDSIHRLIKARLIIKDNGYKPVHRNLKEFILHGIKFAFVPEIGQPMRGMPTASFAPPLNSEFAPSDALPHVWPDAHGTDYGISFSPLHKSAPEAARRDPALYELLAMVDAIRGGEARERDMAAERLAERLSFEGSDELSRLRSPAIREKIAEICSRYHVKRLMLFGSAARGELTANSDIDLLSEFYPEQAPSLTGLFEMRRELSALLNRGVDLATPSILNNPFRRRAIMRDAEDLYAA